MRLIDADALDETFSRLNDNGWQLTRGDHKRIESVLFEMPTIDAAPVVRAYWKSVPNKRERVCSRCEADEPYKFADDDANVYNFCASCGADMREVDDEKA